MPQDSLRSAVYRSFITCDDPKGVVECSSAIRRSKSSKAKNKDHKTKGSLSTSTEQRSTEELQNLSSYQISEVSKGAQKLNDVIGSLSNDTSFGNQSKFIAKDLLKGALHLQESLAMLGKLQEASRTVAKPKKRSKEKDEGTGMDSNRFEEDNDWVKSERSSRDCYDELRDVIRESFARQNLLPKVCANEKDSLERRSLDLGVDFPSTSSSQSSMIPGHSSECSPFESSVHREKPRGPNLIAKLMGLEEASIVPGSVVCNKFPDARLPNQRSYLVDIDLARPRKPQLMFQKAVRERRTLEEMIETIQFKGLLGRSIDGSNHVVDFSDVCLLRRCSSAAEDPCIVIMKPQQVPALQAKEFHPNYEERSMDSLRMRRKRTEDFAPGRFDVLRAQWMFSETNEKLPAGIAPKQKIKENKEARPSVESHAKLVKITVDSKNNVPSMKINHCKSLPAKMQKKEEIVKKMDTALKGYCNKTKEVEMKGGNSQEPAKTPVQGKTTTLKISKAARGSNVGKVQVARGKNTGTEKPIKPKSPKPSILGQNVPKSKPNNQTSAADLAETMQCDSQLPADVDSHIPERFRSATPAKIIQEVINASSDPMPDDFGDASSSSCESSVPSIKVDLEHIEEGICSPFPVSNGCKSMTNTKYILLSSKSFLNRAKQLSNTRPCDSTVSPTTWFPDGKLIDASIVLKCAEEILERKSEQHAINSLSQNLTNPKCRLSLDQLTGEICDDIEELRNYSKPCDESILLDSICWMIKRDLSAKGGVIGNWDLGWDTYFSTEQVNKVANHVEKLVLSEVVEDTVAQLIF